ncbi:MAG: hypothetical protein H0T15_10240, partial [Thermoleophilaceae bacterium]|nr:hypothetical protein [Thermoleophilaceae bacterium]
MVVLRTLGAKQRRLIGGKRARAVDHAEPEPVPTARATLVAAKPFESDEQAQSWLAQLRRDDDATAAALGGALTRLNAVLRAYRAAAGNPAVRDVDRNGALVARMGYGGGDQVVEGRFEAAYELPPPSTAGGGRRGTLLAPQERLAALLSGRAELHPSEELVLRAQADIRAGRPREAAL